METISTVPRIQALSPHQFTFIKNEFIKNEERSVQMKLLTIYPHFTKQKYLIFFISITKIKYFFIMMNNNLCGDKNIFKLPNNMLKVINISNLINSQPIVRNSNAQENETSNSVIRIVRKDSIQQNIEKETAYSNNEVIQQRLPDTQQSKPNTGLHPQVDQTQTNTRTRKRKDDGPGQANAKPKKTIEILGEFFEQIVNKGTFNVCDHIDIQAANKNSTVSGMAPNEVSSDSSISSSIIKSRYV
jgi:hypothetical protein